MRGIKTVLLCLLALTVAAAARAQFTCATNADNLTITGYTGIGGDLTIPTNINGLTVTGIGASAFAELATLTSVTIPSTITFIGDYAFNRCENLGSVGISGSVTNIGAGAFEECNRLTNALIANGSLATINDFAFSDTSITAIAIPDAVTNLGNYAFDGTRLTNVFIPGAVGNIGASVFGSCLQMTAIMVATNNSSYSSVAGVLFDKNQDTLIEYPAGLAQTYVIPNSVKTIADAAFSDCHITNVIIPNGITNIGSYTFANSRLVNVTIPDTVVSIGDSAFSEATLVNVAIPGSVTSIGAFAFSSTYLTNIIIPGSVTNLGSGAFLESGDLKSVQFLGNSPTADNTVFKFDNPAISYLPGTTGWGATFAGLPTSLLFLPNPVILNNRLNFGVQSNKFGFIISWATNASIVIEASTNPANPAWLPVATNSLIGGSSYFADADWANYRGRFYRLRAP